MECDRAAVGRDLEAAGDEAVEAEGLCRRARQQTFVDVLAQAVGCDAQIVERVQAVERADRAEPQNAALGGVGIDVRQLREVSGKRRAAVHCNTVRRDGCRLGHGQDRAGHQP